MAGAKFMVVHMSIRPASYHYMPVVSSHHVLQSHQNNDLNAERTEFQFFKCRLVSHSPAVVVQRCCVFYLQALPYIACSWQCDSRCVVTALFFFLFCWVGVDPSARASRSSSSTNQSWMQEIKGTRYLYMNRRRVGSAPLTLDIPLAGRAFGRCMHRTSPIP